MSLFRETLPGLVTFPAGVIRYALTGFTPPSAHMAMINFFCASGGRSNDVINRIISWMDTKVDFQSRFGVLGNLDQARLKEIVGSLNESGYFVFPNAISQEMCDRLTRFALDTDANLRRMDHEPALTAPRLMRVDPEHPKGVRYDYPVDVLVDNSDVQSLLADHSILLLAQAYLGACPKLDCLSMWWHTAFQSRPDEEAAQLFHFDLDRPKWLKVFIYLTDVGPADGPHTFVAGSHRPGGIPLHLLKKGYARLTDQEVLEHYGKERIVEFCARRGTIVVEDTRGLHKGKPVTGSARLLLQLQLSNSLFGADYPRVPIKTIRHPALSDLLARAPRIYDAYR
jgi:hypothetical protein